ncbi:MAG: flagellar hook-basal body complex protein [Hyphomonadaceae bacterium]|nr:flagellar hook-basal body complex protein [Clostridia bacterium]
MIRSMQGIAYAMKVQTDRMNVIANNIANIETRAYKREVVNIKSFDDVMAKAMQFNTGEAGNNLGPMSLGVKMDEQRTIFDQGYISKTDFNTDFAIRGDGFFEVQTPTGQSKYTRAGNFAFDKNGFLTTQDGDFVMGEKGKIQIPTKKLTVKYEGEIVSENQFVDRFRIVAFNDLRLLQKADAGNYTTNNQNIKKPNQTNILQGYIENSNVNVVEETRGMMETKRNYESGQQIIKMLDDTMGKAASEIGRL